MQNLPPRALAVSAEQGWDEESIITHLVGFIESQALLPELEDYFTEVAEEENEGEDQGEDEASPDFEE